MVKKIHENLDDFLLLSVLYQRGKELTLVIVFWKLDLTATVTEGGSCVVSQQCSYAAVKCVVMV